MPTAAAGVWRVRIREKDWPDSVQGPGSWCKAPFVDITGQEPSHVDNAKMDEAGYNTSNNQP
jgi:hypothetical protein